MNRTGRSISRRTTGWGASVPLPMRASTGPVPGGDGWAFEFRWSGVRAIVEINARGVRAFSATGRDITAVFPELRALGRDLGHRSYLLDGEIVALDAAGRPSLDVLAHRGRVREPDDILLQIVPARFYAFDVLAAHGQDTTGLPYALRRAVLDGLGLAGPVGYAPPYLTGQGSDVLDAAREAGIDGIVAKRSRSVYQPGSRSRDWVATALTPTRHAIIVGWKPGQGRLAGRIGALVLAGNDRYARLTWLGNVGTGFTATTLDQLDRALSQLGRPASPLYRPLPSAAARDVRWVEPLIVGEVAFRTLTGDGRLRNAAWRGIRTDRTPDQVMVEA